MSKLPAVTGRQAVTAFSKIGYSVRRTTGSHHIMAKSGHRLLSIPVHGNKTLKPGTLRGLIRGAGITVEEFCDLL